MIVVILTENLHLLHNFYFQPFPSTASHKFSSLAHFSHFDSTNSQIGLIFFSVNANDVCCDEDEINFVAQKKY